MSKEFRRDMKPLLAHGISWDVDEAFRMIEDHIYPRLQGAPWKASKPKI